MLRELLTREDQLLAWLSDKKVTFHHYYSSIDLRENTYKASPVDINLFPSGFNNFNQKILQEALQQTLPPGQKVGLVAENFSRNERYLANINNLKGALELLGLDVSLLTIVEGKLIILEGLSLPKLDYLLLNNDLSDGAPEELFSLPSLPSPLFGWYQRRKSCHFQIYNDLVGEMAKDLNFDPWLLTAYLDKASGIDFRNKVGLEELAKKAELLLDKIILKYQEYKIKEKPYLFIKAEAGTFGMGVFQANSGEAILSINKKTRHSLANIKGNKANNAVILQEGIITSLEEEGKAAERVLYQIKDLTLGSLVRFNDNRNLEESLNSPGMQMKFLGPARKLDKIIIGLANLALEREFLLLSNESSQHW